MDKDEYKFWTNIVLIFTLIISIVILALWSIVNGNGLIALLIISVYSGILLVIAICELIKHTYK